MGVQVSQGTQLAIAATYGTVFTITAITNAAEAVATLSAAHGVIVGDLIEITSGWGNLTRRIVRAKTVATNDVTLESIDTTSTTRFPAGAGAGSGREILTWTSITQIKDFSAEVPSVDFIDTTFLEDQTRTEIPGLVNAVKITATFGYDLTLAWLPVVRAASQANLLTAIRMITPASNKIYGNGYWKLSEFPAPAIGDIIKNGLNISLSSDATAYAT